METAEQTDLKGRERGDRFRCSLLSFQFMRAVVNGSRNVLLKDFIRVINRIEIS